MTETEEMDSRLHENDDENLDTNEASDAVQTQDVNVQERIHDEVSQAQEPSLEEKITALEAELTAEKDKHLRAYAELENYKKRIAQEVDATRKYAAEKVVLAFLPVIDDLERALAAAQQADANVESVQEGLNLVLKQTKTALEKLDVTEIDSLNQAFDPHKHQAVLQEEKEGVAADQVISVMQKGYSLKDRVIRPAMVSVSK